MFIEHSLANSAADNRASSLPSVLSASYSDRLGKFRQFGREMGPWFRVLAFIAVFSCCCRAAMEEDLMSLVQRAFDLHQKGEFAQALPLLHRAYALQPDDYFVNLLLGIDTLRTGQGKAA